MRNNMLLVTPILCLLCFVSVSQVNSIPTGVINPMTEETFFGTNCLGMINKKLEDFQVEQYFRKLECASFQIVKGILIRAEFFASSVPPDTTIPESRIPETPEIRCEASIWTRGWLEPRGNPIVNVRCGEYRTGVWGSCNFPA